MRIRRGQKVVNPKTGERKYIRVEVECTICGKCRIVSPEELDNALNHSKHQVRFKCDCDPTKTLSIHRQWFNWHTYGADIFPSW